MYQETKTEKAISWLLVGIAMSLVWFVALTVTTAFWSQMSFDNAEGLLSISLVVLFNLFAIVVSELALMIRAREI
jgi:hypothetical protein